MEYRAFLEAKSQSDNKEGFKPIYLPDTLFDFQKALTDWTVWKGRGAVFADCGLGKTLIQLVWAENIVRKTNKPVLVLTPLAVASQTVREGEKFGIECFKSNGGKIKKGIAVTNYQKLGHFDKNDFAGVVCDESSILKNCDGSYRKDITEFMKKVSYRLLCTATAAPNDYIELGTSSAALGQLGYMDMLNRFFKNDQNTSNPRIAWRAMGGVEKMKWRFKGHAEKPFWRWVSSWARVLRQPSDLGFDNSEFILPPLIEQQHIVKTEKVAPGFLFALPAVGLQEQRDERKRTVEERCEMVAKLVDHNRQALVWCHLNTEGDLLEKLIPDAVQIKGSDREEMKESSFLGFAEGKIRVLVTKPKIGAWGLNFQNCSHLTFFPSHSFEQYYQGVRRCWRFGQKNPVTVDIITTEGEQEVMKNLQRKQAQADKMFEGLLSNMQQALSIKRSDDFTRVAEVPGWLLKN